MDKKKKKKKKKDKSGSPKQADLGSLAFGDSEKSYSEEKEEMRNRVAVSEPDPQRCPSREEGSSSEKPKTPSKPKPSDSKTGKGKPHKDGHGKKPKGESVTPKETPKVPIAQLPKIPKKPADSKEEADRPNVLPGDQSDVSGWQGVDAKGKPTSLSKYEAALEQWRKDIKKDSERWAKVERKREKNIRRNERRKSKGKGSDTTPSASGSDATPKGGTSKDKPSLPTNTQSVPDVKNPKDFPLPTQKKPGIFNVTAPFHGEALPADIGKQHTVEEVPAGSLCLTFKDGVPRWMELGKPVYTPVRKAEEPRLRRAHACLEAYCEVRTVDEVPLTPTTRFDRFTGLPNTAGRRDAGGNVSLGLRRADSIRAPVLSRDAAIPTAVAVYTETFVPREAIARFEANEKEMVRVSHPTLIVSPPPGTGTILSRKIALSMMGDCQSRLCRTHTTSTNTGNIGLPHWTDHWPKGVSQGDVVVDRSQLSRKDSGVQMPPSSEEPMDVVSKSVDGASTEYAGAIEFGFCPDLVVPEVPQSDYAQRLGLQPLVPRAKAADQPLLPPALRDPPQASGSALDPVVHGMVRPRTETSTSDPAVTAARTRGETSQAEMESDETDAEEGACKSAAAGEQTPIPSGEEFESPDRSAGAKK